MKRSDKRSDALWTQKISVLVVLVVLVVFSLGFVFDRFLIKEGIPRVDVLLITNAIPGLVAGLLFYQFARNEKREQEFVRERMRTIAELNHHIRNALQVIKFCGSDQANLGAMQLQLIKESANRIEWALKEVLPRYPWPPSNKSPESALAEAHWQYVPPAWSEPRPPLGKHANPH